MTQTTGRPVTTSLDGRLTWTLDLQTGHLVGELPNGSRLEMVAIDAHRLHDLLVENEESLEKAANEEWKRIDRNMVK